MTRWPGLTGRNVLVTGAAGGIGQVVAKAAAQAGARLVVTDSSERVTDLVDGLDGEGHHAVVADLLDPMAPDQIVRAAVDHLGSLDGFAHMAAVLRRTHDINEVTLEDWDLQHTVNLKATFLLARASAEAMKPHGGSIVLFSSQGWWSGGFGGSVVYAATKGGVVSMARGLARTYGPDQITVNTVAPGFVDTPMLLQGLSDADVQGLVSSTPLGRLAQPEDLAGPVLFLLSDLAGFVSGATLNVSGGALMY